MQTISEKENSKPLYDQGIYKVDSQKISERKQSPKTVTDEASYKPLHPSETLSFWRSQTKQAQSKRMNFMATQIKAIVALKMQKQDCIPSEIINGIFLGSIGAALSKITLNALQITHILTAADKIKPAHPNHFTYKCVPLLDSPTQNIKAYFEESNQFIDQAIKSEGKVLVHWQVAPKMYAQWFLSFAGKSRSTTLIISYLMWKHRKNLDECLTLIRQKRAIACPNFGFMKQLRMYQATLIKAGHIVLPDDSDSDENQNASKEILNKTTACTQSHEKLDDAISSSISQKNKVEQDD